MTQTATPAPTILPTAAPIVSVRDLSMVFPVPGGQTVALQDANLQIMPGEFISLIGPSGCGKTTLLRLMADLITPTGGELSVNGGTPRAARENRAYGYVFQAPALMEWRNVLSNVRLPLEVMNAPRGSRDSRAREMLQTRRAGKVRALLPLAALRRHAAARLYCPRPGV